MSVYRAPFKPWPQQWATNAPSWPTVDPDTVRGYPVERLTEIAEQMQAASRAPWPPRGVPAGARLVSTLRNRAGEHRQKGST